MTNTSPTHPVRSWLGITYAAAERFRSPTLLPFDPDLPYDQKSPHLGAERTARRGTMSGGAFELTR